MPGVTFLNHPSDSGGPSIFTKRLAGYLRHKKFIVSYGKISNRIIFIAGGSRHLLWLLFMKINGSKIIHRLDGIFWQHRYEKTSWHYYIKCEIRNFSMLVIYKLFANYVVFQSNYIKEFWIQKFGAPAAKYQVIYNSCNASRQNNFLDKGTKKIICIEGSVNGAPAYEILKSIKDINVDVYGKYKKEEEFKDYPNIKFKGERPNQEILRQLEGKKVYLCLETNPPCPNAVIEALSHGIPVVGFNSGSLLELVGKGGIILDYDGNPDLLEVPKNKAQINAALNEVFSNYKSFSHNAFDRSQELFNFNDMAKKYYSILRN